MDKKNVVLMSIVALYVGLMVMAPIASTKISLVFGLKLPSGSILVALALVLLDVVNNLYGRGSAKSVVFAGLITRAFVHLGMMSLILALPIVHQPKGFEKVLAQGIRNVVAGELATFVAQWFIDIPVFALIKERMKGKYFFIRYNISNLFSHAISAPIFVIGAFYGTPKLDLVAVILSQLTFRYLASFSLTPVAVIINRGVKWLIS